jgi:hypothetical protein
LLHHGSCPGHSRGSIASRFARLLAAPPLGAANRAVLGLPSLPQLESWGKSRRHSLTCNFLSFSDHDDAVLLNG